MMRSQHGRGQGWSFNIRNKVGAITIINRGVRMAMSVLPEKIYGGGKLIAGSLEIKYKNKQSIKVLLDIYR